MLNFLGQYLRDPRGVGAVAPSSPALARAMVDAADLGTSRTIIEYGTGVFTQELVRRRARGTKIVAIERNAAFCGRLRAQFAGTADLVIVEGSAADVAGIAADQALSRVDCILSGLPLSSLPNAVTETILSETTAMLADHGRFVLFQYSRYRRNMLSRHFRTISNRYVLANLPPAYVFCCDNRKTGRG